MSVARPERRTVWSLKHLFFRSIGNSSHPSWGGIRNEDGTITGMEKEITVADLPKVIADAIAAKYPTTKAKKAEEVIKVKDGKEVLEYFEVTVEVDSKDVEVEVLPDGKLKPMDKK